MPTKGEGIYENLLNNLDPLKGIVSSRAAYLGVIAGGTLFMFSLFLAWCKVVDVTNVADDGISTGWAEGGYLAILPMTFVAYRVIRNKSLAIWSVILATIFSLGLLTYDNVIHRTSWSTHTVCNDGDCSLGHNLGSDLAGGFWIGLLALLTTAICGLAWGLHKTALVGQELVNDSAIKESSRLPNRTEGQARSKQTSGSGTLEQLERLARLRDQGVLSEIEFERQKSLLLSRTLNDRRRYLILVALGAVILVIGAVVWATRTSTQRGSPPVVTASADESLVRAPAGWSPSNNSLIAESAKFTSIGQCKMTTIREIGYRLGSDMPDSGTEIAYGDGTFGVSYETEAGAVSSKPGEQIKLCLTDMTKDCPAGDDRGKTFTAHDLANGKSWSLPNAEHDCGGA